MSAFLSPADFALQSSSELRISQALRQERGLVCLVEARRYPISGIVVISALRPSRHYRLGGAAQGYCRTDADGTAAILVTLTRSTLLAVEGVVA